MAFSDYSLTPASNSTIGGKNVAENCPPANINDALRQLAADGRALFDSLPDTSTLVPKSGAVFTDQPKVLNRGGLLHHANSANAAGRIYVQAEGAALPTLSNGDIVLSY